jgi:hypothetical protein
MNELFSAKFKFPSSKIYVWEDIREKRLARLKYASEQGIKPLIHVKPHWGSAIIVGGGPLVVNFVNDIKRLSENPYGIVCSLNGAHQWLINQGITPNIHVLFEDDIECVEDSLGGPPCKGTVYYICSHCDQNIFNQLKDHKRVIWHPDLDIPEYREAIYNLFPGQFLVQSGYVTFFRTLSLAIILGFKDFDLFGVDCSFDGESDHLEGYKWADREEKINMWGRDDRTNELRHFRSNGSLAYQAYEFLNFCDTHTVGLRVHGDSLLRHIHKGRYPQMYLEKED